MKRGEKYKKYNYDVQLSILGTRKYDCTFKLIGKPIGNGEGFVSKDGPKVIFSDRDLLLMYVIITVFS